MGRESAESCLNYKPCLPISGGFRRSKSTNVLQGEGGLQ
jgi:hypothetical protein